MLMFGRTVSGFGSRAKRGSPLSGSISLAKPDGATLVLAGIAPGSSGTSNAGDIDVTAAGSGGAGSYTYSWAVAELDDSSSVYSIGAAGTQNAAQYNTLTITGANPAPPNPPANPGTYRLRVTITDGASATVNVDQNITILIA